MPQLVNTILISIVAFFAFLAVFGLLGGTPRAESHPGETAVHLAGVSARWEDGATTAARARGQDDVPAAAGPSDPAGPSGAAGPSGGAVILLELAVRNPGSASATVAAVAYEATSGGVTFDEGAAPQQATVAPRRDVAVTVPVRIPADAMPLWWQAYGASGEATGLRIAGTVRVFDEAGEHELPFSWSSAWQGELASGLDAAQFACRTGDPVCVADVGASWAEGALVARLGVVVHEDPGATVTAARIGLRLADRLVAASDLQPSGAGGADAAAFAGALLMDAAELSAWFPGHADRCESSRLEWRVTMDVGLSDGQVDTVSWSVRGTFQTHWVCGVSP